MKRILFNAMVVGLLTITPFSLQAGTVCHEGQEGCNPSLLPIRLITENVTLNISDQDPGSNFALCGWAPLKTVQDALSCLDQYKIASDVKVTIAVKDSPEQPYDTVYVNHSDGQNISIIGDCTKENEKGICKIQFKPGDGFIVSAHRALGDLENFELQGTGKVSSSGVRAWVGSSLSASNITVSKFYWGIIAQTNSSMMLNNVVAENNAYGINSEYASSVMLTNGNASNNAYSGFAISGSALMWTSQNITAQGNGNVDFIVQASSSLTCMGDTVMKVGAHSVGPQSSANDACWQST